MSSSRKPSVYPKLKAHSILSLVFQKRKLRFQEVKGLTQHLKPGLREGQDLKPCVPAVMTVLLLFTSSLPRLSSGPVSCPTLSLLNPQGCGMLIRRGKSDFSLYKRRKKSHLNRPLNLAVVFFGREYADPGAILTQLSYIYFSFRFQQSCRRHGTSAVRCPYSLKC